MFGVAAVLCTAATVSAQDGMDVSVKGFVDTYHAMRIEAPNDWMSSRTRVRGEFRLEKNGGGAFVSANLIYNALLNDQSGFQLREAYLYWGNSDWDIRAGKQIITWGVADGLRVTDLISPMDYTEFLAQDYDDIRVPVGALRARYIHNAWSLEAVLVPVPDFYKIPTDPANPWSMGPLPPEVVVDHLGYHRITAVGGDLSIPFGQFVLRGELADYIDDHGNHQGCALAGLDWYPGADWTLSAQFNQTYESGVQASLATLRISKALFNNALTLSTFAYADVKDLGLFNRFGVDWAATYQIHAIVGFDYFYAEDGMFKAYKDNSEIWIN
ncbi:MAG: hypothetical protein K6A73_08680 [Bacteroidales bacterium]|nr:hypothetical protein [Bacteroidales bacterium]